MPFPRKYLHESEDIVIDRKPHLWYLVQPVAAFLGTLVVGVLAASKINPRNNSVNGYITWAAIALPTIALLWFAWTYVKWRTTNFVVTTDRLIFRQGVVAKKGKEIPLERINDISFNQTIFERLIGAGDLLIESGGEQGQQRFSDIRKPFEVQNLIYKSIEQSKARDMDRMAGRRELSVPEQIEKLDDLRQKGTITQADFDAKKTQLLDKM